jgi:hypothetical protein
MCYLWAKISSECVMIFHPELFEFFTLEWILTIVRILHSRVNSHNDHFWMCCLISKIDRILHSWVHSDISVLSLESASKDHFRECVILFGEQRPLHGMCYLISSWIIWRAKTTSRNVLSYFILNRSNPSNRVNSHIDHYFWMCCLISKIDRILHSRVHSNIPSWVLNRSHS